MNKPSRITGPTAPTITGPAETHRHTVPAPTVARRLIAAGVKRGTGPLTIQAVTV